MAKSLYDGMRVKPGKKVHLGKWDPADTHGWDEEKAREKTAGNIEKIAGLQRVLAAQGERGMLIVLQAMDAGGKDGTIRNLARGLNPLGCRVAAFKAPTPEELSHDFLWRIHKVCPGRGEIVIFNRSHYEDVLVVRVRELVSRKVWSKRYARINEFEDLVASAGISIVKLYLHISKDEQKRRLEERLAEPKKHWKFNTSDLAERDRWDLYMEAYEAALSECSTKKAPWFIVPADEKWFRDLVVSEVVLKTLEDLDLRFPDPPPGLASVVVK
ncbi:MAG: polyphosphate kinase 2 family protein [Acidobacteria bacterium]|nr:polyphosphate kinase 2 family protein [Acidobacteriota bacterium]